MPVQTGVGVPGGLSMMTAFVEAMMRLDRGKKKLDVDITNMFNELCRVTLMEELLESEELVGVDFSDLAPYFESAFSAFPRSAAPRNRTRCSGAACPPPRPSMGG
jgi:hypothetical protein